MNVAIPAKRVNGKFSHVLLSAFRFLGRVLREHLWELTVKRCGLPCGGIASL